MVLGEAWQVASEGCGRGGRGRVMGMVINGLFDL